MGLDLFGAEEVVDCESGYDLFVPVVCFPHVNGCSACHRARRGVVEICGRFALSFVGFAVCLWDFELEAVAGVSGSAVVLGASGAGGLGDGELTGVEEESVGIGVVEGSLLPFESSFLGVDEVDSSFADALFHGSVLFDCDCDGEVVLFLESFDFGLKAILFKEHISTCSLICIEERTMLSW